MDFGFNDEQEMLRQSARGVLEKECPTTLVRHLMEDDRGFDPALWKKMAELGWMGLVLPEEYGGSALNYVDLVLVLEEMGRVVLPSPFIWTMLFAEALKRVGSDAQKSALLPKIATGDLSRRSPGWNRRPVGMRPRLPSLRVRATSASSSTASNSSSMTDMSPIIYW